MQQGTLPKGLGNIDCTIHCFDHYFKDPNKRPYISLKVSSSLIHRKLHYWIYEASDGEREILKRFLNGERIACEKNTVSFEIPESTLCQAPREMRQTLHNDEELVKYLFTENGCRTINGDLDGVKVEIDNESIKLIKSSNMNVFGENYHKVKIGFNSYVRFDKRVRDIPHEQIANHFFSQDCNFDRQLSMLKAIVNEPNKICCDAGEAFITYRPQTCEDATRFFTDEFKYSVSLNYEDLMAYASEFAKNYADRKIIAKYRKSFVFDKNHIWAFDRIGNTAFDGWDEIQILASYASLYPWEYVKSIRKGIAEGRAYMEECKTRERLRNYNSSFGHFTITVTCDKKAERGTYTSTNCSNLQGSVLFKCDCAVDFMGKVFGTLEAFANFLETVLGNITNHEKQQKALADYIMNMVNLSPVDFADSENPAVRRYANYCISGEM